LNHHQRIVQLVAHGKTKCQAHGYL